MTTGRQTPHEMPTQRGAPACEPGLWAMHGAVHAAVRALVNPA